MSNGRATNEEKQNLKHSMGASFGHISEDPGEWTPGTWTESTDEGPSTEGSICVFWGHCSPVSLAEEVCQNTKANYLAMQNLTLKNSNYGPSASRCAASLRRLESCWAWEDKGRPLTPQPQSSALAHSVHLFANKSNFFHFPQRLEKCRNKQPF